MNKLSVIINTYNEEKNIKRAIESVRWADEVIICDMYSDDETVKLAKKLGAKTIFHKRTNYVEPARNFAISKAANNWVLILDSDEEIPATLSQRLQEIVEKEEEIDFVELPRKNIIFGKWMKATGWWPDYQTRLFKKGAVTWKNEIHSKPDKSGSGLTLDAQENWAILHHNYQSISQFLQRMDRYTDIEAEDLKRKGYKFNWLDLPSKPTNEFLSRFFANSGYKDGLHGLSLSLLQAFSFFILYLKIWEREKFEEREIQLSELREESEKEIKSLEYWFKKSGQSPFKKFIQQITNKI